MLGHITAVLLAPEAIPVKIWARFYYMYFWAALSHTQGKGLYKLRPKPWTTEVEYNVDRGGDKDRQPSADGSVNPSAVWYSLHTPKPQAEASVMRSPCPWLPEPVEVWL